LDLADNQPMAKRPELIIEPQEFPLFLKARMMNATVADFAKGLGVTPSLVYMLLAGTKKPSLAILKKLGLDVVYRARMPERK
jgi:hypothetical protein